MTAANFEFFARTRTGAFARWSVILLAIMFCVVCPASAQSPSDEYHVKAAFLFHFAQLVEWPSDTPYGATNSLLVCTLGNDPFHGALEETIAGKQVGNRTLRIRHLGTLQDRPACNVLFVGASESKRFSSTIAQLRNLPVLTVGEGDGFLEAGGMIRFCMDGKKIHFEVNRGAAESARLKISAQLLLLAKSVFGGNGGR